MDRKLQCWAHMSDSGDRVGQLAPVDCPGVHQGINITDADVDGLISAKHGCCWLASLAGLIDCKCCCAHGGPMQAQDAGDRGPSYCSHLPLTLHS